MSMFDRVDALQAQAQAKATQASPEASEAEQAKRAYDKLQEEAAEAIKGTPKKARGWPKGKPRGSRKPKE